MFKTIKYNEGFVNYNVEQFSFIINESNLFFDENLVLKNLKPNKFYLIYLTDDIGSFEKFFIYSSETNEIDFRNYITPGENIIFKIVEFT
jgi:hypothetical protein